MPNISETKRVCIWKWEKQAIRVSSSSVISYIEQKIEFSRELMEEALGLNEGQAYWHMSLMNLKFQLQESNIGLIRVSTRLRRAKP